MRTEALELYLNNLLDVRRFQDYCPNGLQVEGRGEIERIVSGVTASLALIEAALDWRADAILVHHGLFWRGDDPRVRGPRRARLRALLGADLNVFAYHLPLDAHPELGNNAQLGARLGLAHGASAPGRDYGRFGRDELGCFADLAVPLRLDVFADTVARALGRAPVVVGDGARPLRRVAWCTGAAQGWIEEAAAIGADVYLSGEISEPTAHLARETGVAYVGAGHHATERGGAAALGAHLAEHFGLSHRFIDIDNPA